MNRRVHDPLQDKPTSIPHECVSCTMTGFSRFEVLAWAATVMLKRHNDENADATGPSQSMTTTTEDDTDEDYTEDETENEPEYCEDTEDENGSDVEKDPDDRNAPYYMHKDWMPTNVATGKQKSPKQLRTELQRYLETTSRTKTSILLDMGVNSNSFRKFMDVDNYKDPWRASTYMQ